MTVIFCRWDELTDEQYRDLVRNGDRVTIRTPQGQELTGRAVMHSGDGRGWVLNLGGRYGTPGLAYKDNTVSACRGRHAIKPQKPQEPHAQEQTQAKTGR